MKFAKSNSFFLSGVAAWGCLLTLGASVSLATPPAVDHAKLKTLAEQGEYFWKFPNGASLLEACITGGETELAKLLISKEALEHIDDGGRLEDVWVAAMARDKDIFYEIINHIDHNKQLAAKVDFSEMLFRAIDFNSPEFIPIALTRGGTFLEVRKKYPRLLEHSVSEGAIEMVDLLASNGFSLTEPDTGDRLLSAAVATHRVDMVKHLLSKGVEVDSDSSRKLSALGRAYAKAEKEENPDFSIINILEEHTQKKCDENRLTYMPQEGSDTKYLTVAELIAKTKNKAFLEKLNTATCQFKILKN